MFVVANVLLFIQLRKPADPERKINYTRSYWATGVAFLLLAWEIYERFGR